ncbi:hypothetical protein D3C80_1440180 [compost metagenome]
MHGAAGVLGFATREFHITLFSRLCDDLLALFKCLRVLERVAVGCAHVIHTDGGNRLHPRVDFCRTDDKAAAATDTENADAVAIDIRLGSQVIDRCAERFGVNIRRHGVTRLSLAFAPE